MGLLTAYLGLGRLILLWLRRFLYYGLLLPILIHDCCCWQAQVIPYFVQGWLYGVLEL